MDAFALQLAKLCRECPRQNKWVSVPSFSVGRALGDRLALEGTNWANLRFFTPISLALQMAAPTLVERGQKPCPDEIGPALVMRLLLDLPSAVPPYFRPLADQPKMSEALWSSLRELRLAGIRSTDMSPGAFVDAGKAAELKALLQSYENYLSTNCLADGASVFETAAECRDWCPVSKEDTWLEFPGVVQPLVARRLLDSLPGNRLETAVLDLPGMVPPRLVKEYGPRFHSTPPHPKSASERLALLLLPDDRPLPGDDVPVEMFRAGGMEAEVEEVFRRIADARLRLDHVEVICASSDYGPLVWEKSQRLGWPVTVEAGIPAVFTRPGRAALAFCEWIENGFPASRLRQLLESGDITLRLVDGSSAGQAARLLLKSGATWGRQTYRSSLAGLTLKYRIKEADVDLDPDDRVRARMNATRAECLQEWIEKLLATVPEPDEQKRCSVQDVVSAVTDFVESNATRSSSLDAAGVGAINEALAKLRVLGPMATSLGQAISFVRNCLEPLSVGASRARPGHLHVSALPAAGYAGRNNSFVVGLEEGRVFRDLVQDPVLLDQERIRLSSALPTTSDRSSEAVYTTVSRLAALGGRVCLSFSCRDLREARETLPSWVLLQAARATSAKPELSYEDLDKRLGEPVSLVPGSQERALSDAGWWLATLRRAGTTGLPAVLKTFARLEQGQAAIAARESAQFTPYDGLVPEAGKVMDPILTGEPVSSTRLQSLAECPFQFFLRYGLGLEAIEDEQRDPAVWLDPMNRGSALHEVYAQVVREARAIKTKITRKSFGARAQAIADQVLNDLRRDAPPPFDESYRRERQAFLDDLDLFVKNEEESKGRTPVAIEVAFGDGLGTDSDDADPLAQSRAVEIPLGRGVVIRLRGRIDRIDQLADGSYEVVDYKTGGYYEPGYAGTFRGGRLLQHALYSVAAVDLLKPLNPKPRVLRGVYYFPTRKGRASRREISRPSAAHLSELLTLLCQVVQLGAFICTSDDGDCKFCKHGKACLSGADQSGNKMGSDYEGLVALQKVHAYE
jgi:ATP-dependent helicase/nuclease subunit B